MIRSKPIWAALGLIIAVSAAWAAFHVQAEAQSAPQTTVTALSNGMFVVATQDGRWSVYEIESEPGLGEYASRIPGSREEAAAQRRNAANVRDESYRVSRGPGAVVINSSPGSAGPAYESPVVFGDKAGLGDRIISTGEDMEIQIQRGNGIYQRELYLDKPGPERLIAPEGAAPGEVIHLGRIPKGQEIVFSLHVKNNDKKFYTGPASRNPDKMEHAIVQPREGGAKIVGFEDIPKSGDGVYPQSDRTYNDFVFLLRPVKK